jgi:thiamine kinase-like enzyme
MTEISIEQVIERVARWRGLDVSAAPLSGGLTNENWLVEASGERYVVRIPGKGTELLAVDRANEVANARAAAEAGVGPEVVDYLPELQAMVLAFVPGETMSGVTLRTPEMARRMAASIRQLHEGPRFLQDFDMFRTAEGYLAICDERGIAIPDGYRDRLRTVEEVERAMRAWPPATVPCHNDLLAENYIDDGERLWIVDYEYSGNNDPTFELANTAQEAEFDNALREELCRAYFDRADEPLLARMRLNALMSDVGWTLWAAIQERISTIDYDFWGWATMRWERAVAIMDDPAFPAWVRAVAQPQARPD